MLSSEATIEGKETLRNFLYNKSFAVVIGDNDSGKTTLVRYLVNGVPKNKVFILNSSGQKWDYPKKNIFRPKMYSTEWFNQFIVWFAGCHSNCTLILDDADSFKVKDNAYLNTVIQLARHSNIGIILSLRMMQDVDRVLYKQAKLYVGTQYVSYDVIYLSRTIGQVAEKVATLPKFVFFNWYRHESRLFKVPTDFAMRWKAFTEAKK